MLVTYDIVGYNNVGYDWYCISNHLDFIPSESNVFFVRLHFFVLTDLESYHLDFLSSESDVVFPRHILLLGLVFVLQASA